MELGEVFYQGERSWVKSDMWSAKRFLEKDERRRHIVVREYDEKITNYISCVARREKIGPLLKFITKVYLMSIKSLTVVFTRSEWPEIFALKDKIESGRCAR